MKARLALLCLCALHGFLLGQAPKPPVAAVPKALQETKAKAEKGDTLAQFNLGAMYYYGLVVAKDEKEAVKWFRKAAEQGDADGQLSLALMYTQGRGVAKDEVEAYKWYLLADAQGREVAKPIIIGIKHRLTAEQRAQGEQRAREWKPTLPPKAK